MKDARRIGGRRARGGAAVMILAATCALAAVKAGCATEESINFGDSNCIAGGCFSNVASSGGTCQPDAACAVSFSMDIVPLLDAPMGCTSTGLCHGDADGAGGLILQAGNASQIYSAILAYNIPIEGPYVVPCNPTTSRMPCNMAVSDGTNPFGSCGQLMPPTPPIPLTIADVQTIAEWIACGAPNN